MKRCFCVLLSVFILCFSVSVPAYAQNPIIVLDAGHGGIDGGAVAADGTVEKNINLEIALLLNDMLLFFGVDTVLTRSRDISIHDDDCLTIHQKKVSDLKNRLSLSNNTDCVCFLSIHQNMFGDSKYSGSQIFYGGKNAASEVFAKSIQQSIKQHLQAENERLPKCSTNDIYVLFNNDKPAVMVECGFMSNKSELEKLKSFDYQKQLCICIMLGVFNAQTN